MNEKFYLVVKMPMLGTKLPVYYYTFAESSEAAIKKVDLKWGNMDSNAFARELQEKELETLVIATNNYG